MVSPLSSRLFASEDSISSSKGSSQKRSISTKPESSLSGYSADREEKWKSPPVVSIDLLERCRKNESRDRDACPKRRKRNELVFAASNVKADLARAKEEIPKKNKDIERTTCLGDIDIDLKGVRLMYSSDFKMPITTSNVSAQTSTFDYESLAKACLESYPKNLSHLKHAKDFVTTQDADSITSSVSDIESDSGDSNGNANAGPQAVHFIPPLLEDSEKLSQSVPSTNVGSCNVISCASNAVTMSEVMQLSKVARLVANSCAPFALVHANAAFMRFSGIAADKNIVGTPFSSILESEPCGNKPISLSECMVSSSSGHHKKMLLRTDSPEKPVECRVKVSPIVARKTQTSEVTTMTHFAIEFTSEDKSLEPNIRTPVVGADLSVGVMG